MIVSSALRTVLVRSTAARPVNDSAPAAPLIETDLALPVVSWLSVGTSPAAIVPNVGAAPFVPFPVSVRNFLVVVVLFTNDVVSVALWYGTDPRSVAPLPPTRLVDVPGTMFA